jgi:hypothetical protein
MRLNPNSGLFRLILIFPDEYILIWKALYETDRDRTDGLALRRRSLYPTELQSQHCGYLEL